MPTYYDGIEYDKNLKECQHPVNDETVVVHRALVEDLMKGRERMRTGYYCQEHQQFGRWMVVRAVDKIDLKTLGGIFKKVNPQVTIDEVI